MTAEDDKPKPLLKKLLSSYVICAALLFVGLEAVVDFLENRLGEPVFGNRDDRVEVMSLGAQFATLGRI